MFPRQIPLFLNIRRFVCLPWNWRQQEPPKLDVYESVHRDTAMKITNKMNYFLFLLWYCDPTRVMAFPFTRILDHAQRRTTFGRTPLDELITRPEESYRLCCVVVCDLETSRMGAPYIYDSSHLRVNLYSCISLVVFIIIYHDARFHECRVWGVLVVQGVQDLTQFPPSSDWMSWHTHSFVTFLLEAVTLKIQFISKLIEMGL